MGNYESIDDYEYKDTIERSADYQKLRNRAISMGFSLVVQSDGSISIQNKKNLVKCNYTVPAPKNKDISLSISSLGKALEDLSSEMGYIHYGYQ